VQGGFEVSMELPPPNPELNPSPSMLESDQTTASSADVRRRNIWPLLLIFGFLGLLAGLLVGGIYFTKCPKVYQSQATITIQPREKRLCFPSHEDTGRFDIRHDQLIGENNILTKCLNNYDLKDLRTFRNLSPTKQIEEIQKNLVVVQNREETTKFELEYFSTDPRDAQTVLATIITTYENHLDEKYRSPSADTVDLSTLVTTGPPSAKIRLATAEKMEEIEAKKSLYDELLLDLRKSEAALKDGREACMECVWILENGGKLEVGSLDDRIRSPILLAQAKKVDELNLQRDRVFVVSHPDPEVVQALNLRINEEEEKLRELTSNENKVREAKGLGVSPEEIIQRFITSKKKQIGELRTALETDFAAYSEIYEEAVRSERNELYEKAARSERNEIYQGFIFETTRPAYRGRQVRPVLAVILPVFALIGAVVGSWFAYLGVLVVGATR